MIMRPYPFDAREILVPVGPSLTPPERYGQDIARFSPDVQFTCTICGRSHGALHHRPEPTDPRLRRRYSARGLGHPPPVPALDWVLECPHCHARYRVGSGFDAPHYGYGRYVLYEVYRLERLPVRQLAALETHPPRRSDRRTQRRSYPFLNRVARGAAQFTVESIEAGPRDLRQGRLELLVGEEVPAELDRTLAQSVAEVIARWRARQLHFLPVAALVVTHPVGRLVDTASARSDFADFLDHWLRRSSLREVADWQYGTLQITDLLAPPRRSI